MDGAAVQELLDKSEISEALLRYCRGIDRCDVELIRSAFHDTAVDDHGDNSMLAHEFAQNYVDRRREETLFAVHRVSNHLIEIEGDVAISEAYVFSIQQVRGEDATQFSASRYLDRFEKRDGVWRIAYRLVVHDWHGSSTFGPWLLSTVDPSHFVPGVRGEADVIIGGRDRLFPPKASS